MKKELKNTIRDLLCRDEYLPDAIESGVLKDILEYVKYTPSAGNVQPWEIILVTDPDKFAELTDTLLDPFLREDDELKQEWIANVPVILVMCMDTKRAKVRFGERGIEFGLMDIGAASSNLLLGAWEYGLRGCIVREFDQDRVRTLLGIPPYVMPLMMITMGYSTQEKAFAPTLELEDFVHKDEWAREWEY